MPATEKTSLRLPTGLWGRFIAFVVDKHGRTHGGVLGQETAAALERHMKQDVNVVSESVDGGTWVLREKITCPHCDTDLFIVPGQPSDVSLQCAQCGQPISRSEEE